MMRKKIQKIVHRLLGKRMMRRIDRDNHYVYKNIHLELTPSIFHPKYFSSSQLLLEWVEHNISEGDRMIEIGCGSGISSLRAAQKGASVWAVDINPEAVEQLKINAENNRISLQVFESNLLKSVPKHTWDYVLVNPPFYPKKPDNNKDFAWYCGENFEFFTDLFKQLSQLENQPTVFMTLSDDCDNESIKTIANNEGFHFQMKEERKQLLETNSLYQVNKY